MYRSRFIRIFISSTFDDMELERNTLQRIVFPNLTKYCNSRGWQFEDVDLRWGINDEASLDQKTMQICLEELRSCQKMSPRPNFLILQGDRYGWIPLPEILTKVQGEKIRVSANKEEIILFDKWYKLDTNHNISAGGCWVLQPRSGEFVDWSYYHEFVEKPLRKLFEREGEAWMNHSATEQEIWAGAFSQPDASDHVVLYDRHLRNVPRAQQTRYSEKWSLFTASGYQRVKRLRHHEARYIQHILRKTMSFHELSTEAYQKWFAKGVEALLRDVVDYEINRYESISDEEIVRLRADEFIIDSATNLIGRKEELEALSNCKGGSVYYLSGPSGSGLSSLSAAFLKDKNALFCSAGITHLSLNGEVLLHAIWERLVGADSGESFSHRALGRLLSSYNGPPIWVVLDGLDHLDEKDEIHREWWLPSNGLSKNVTLIITGDKEALKEFSLVINPTISIHEFSIQEALFYIDKRLGFFDASISSEQREYVKALLNDNQTLIPRYLNLLCADILNWRSYDEDWSIRFSGNINMFLDSVKQLNGPQLSKSSFELLASSQMGISILELRLFLMRDADFREEFTSHSHHMYNGKLAPTILCTRFLKDISPFTHQASLFDTFLSKIDESQLMAVLENSYGRFSKEVFSFYDMRWRSGDVHALYEVGNIARSLNDRELTLSLFCDLEYCIAKLLHGCSSKLRYQMSDYCKINSDIRDFVHFDTDAEAYCMEHKDLDARSAVMYLAATWRPESAIRKAFDSLSMEGTMLNTMGWRSYLSNSFITIPGEPDDTAFPTEDGMALWIQEKDLMSADYNSGEVKQVSKGKLFQYIGNGECILYDGRSFSLLKDHFHMEIFSVCDGRYCDFEIDNFIGYRDAGGAYHIAFIANSNVYWLVVQISYELRFSFSVPVQQGTEYKLDLDKRWKWKTGGFLMDGKSIVLQALVCEGDKQTKVQVMKVDRSENSLSFDYKGSFVSVADCQHDGYSPYLSLFPAITTDGKNHIATIHFKYNGGAYCVTYLATYSDGGMSLTDLDLSACSLGRGWTYYLHLSNDGETLLHCSLDTRLVKYNLKCKKIDSVLHLPSEGIGPHASLDNNYVLFDNREYHKDYKKDYLPLYNRLLNYNNLSTADDYFDSGLTTLSADSKASIILTSFGTYYFVCAESASGYFFCGDNLIRKSLPKEETWSFSTAVAVSQDGGKYAYALGAGDCASPEHWQYVIRDNDGHVYQTNGNVTMMEFTPDGQLLALLSHLSPTVCHQFLIIDNGNVQRLNLHRMDAKDSTLIRGKYVSFKLSPNGSHVLYCSNKYGRYSLGILDLTNKNSWEIASNVENYWWSPDSRSICFTIFSTDNTILYDLVSRQTTVIHDVAMAIDPFGCHFAFKAGDDGICQGAKEIHLGEPIEQVVFCPDGRHCFAITENAVFLIDWDIVSVVQRFYLAYPDDASRKYFSEFWVAGGSSKNKPKRISHHIRLYDKGLLMSDWDTLFRLEPENGYKINEEVLTTLREDGTYRCPICGQLHEAAIELIRCVDTFENIPCYNIPEEKWDAPALRGYKCKHCGVKLRFNPFVVK